MATQLLNSPSVKVLIDADIEGTLTNIAALFAVDPTVAKKIKEIVIMGGSFLSLPEHIEYNIDSNPYAASVVFNSGVKIRCVGFDITKDVQMSADEFKNAATAEIMRSVMDYASVWFEESDNITYHDPLAGAMIFNDDICQYKKGIISVDVDKKLGLTNFEENENGNHRIVVSADKANLLSIILK